MDFKAFLKTLAAAAISGAITTTASVYSDPTAVVDPATLCPIAIAGAIVGAAGYLSQSPRPPKAKKPSAPKAK
jgi:hypothetical protein